MNTAFSSVATALLVWLAVYYIYWWLVRPALATKLRLGIAQTEGQVLTAMLETSRPERRSALRVVMDRCNRAKRNVASLTLSRVLLAEITPEVEANFQLEQNILAGASDDIKELARNVSLRLYFALMINSPLFATIGIGLIAMMEIFGTLRRFFGVVVDRTWEATAASNQSDRSSSTHAVAA